MYSIPPENSLDIAIIEQAIADYLYEHSNSSTDIYKNGIFDLLSIIQKNGIDKINFKRFYPFGKSRIKKINCSMIISK